MAKPSIALTVIIIVILSALLIFITNLGISTFYNTPKYDDYCRGCVSPSPIVDKSDTINQACYQSCQEDYNNALKSYSQNIFYILAGLGLLFLLLGLFINMSIIQYTGLISGGVLAIEGIVRNFESKTSVFVASVALFVIFIVFAVIKFRRAFK